MKIFDASILNLDFCRRKIPCLRVQEKSGRFTINTSAIKFLKIKDGDFIKVGEDNGFIYIAKSETAGFHICKQRLALMFISKLLWKELRPYFRKGKLGILWLEIEPCYIKLQEGEVFYKLKYCEYQ